MGNPTEGTVPPRPRLRIVLSKDQKTYNTIQLAESITCLRLSDGAFSFGKSFLRPSAAKSLKAQLIKHHSETLSKLGDWKVTVFGHADPEGSVGFNKKLSVRRAEAVVSFITRDAETWSEFWELEKWGAGEIRTVLLALGKDASNKEVQSHLSHTYEAIDRRKALFAAYMNDPAYAIDNDLLAGHFTDPPYVGCGEYNPIHEYTKKDYPNKEKRRRLNAINRRVTLFFWWGSAPVDFPKDCDKVDCLGSRKQNPLPGDQQFRCEFYWRHFRTTKCESPSSWSDTMTNCIKLESLYDYLLKKNLDKGDSECTLLRILHQFFDFRQRRCRKKGLDGTMLFPWVYDDFLKAGGFPEVQGNAEYPYMGKRLFRITDSEAEISRMVAEMDAKRIPKRVLDAFSRSGNTLGYSLFGSYFRGVHWVVIDREKKRRFHIVLHPRTCLTAYYYGYRPMLEHTRGGQGEYGYLWPLSDERNRLHEENHVSFPQFLDGGSYHLKLDFIDDELLRIVADKEFCKGGVFDPARATGKLTKAVTGRYAWSTLNGWLQRNGHTRGDSLIFCFEKHYDALYALKMDTFRSETPMHAVEMMFLRYYNEKLAGSSIYGCFKRGSPKTDRTLPCVRGGKCDPAHCLAVR